MSALPKCTVCMMYIWAYGQSKGAFTHADFVETDTRTNFGADSVCDPLLCLHCKKSAPNFPRIRDYVELELVRKMSAKIQILVLLSSFCS